ncbi:hypothetical protein [uncultured Lacinutrix sp.]|uniref:hypothetical protein n=1 Tax=uncultured Lacinutrix sp. TaxID=574032 RepID=UPI00262A846C|nr:hypothetical protein [uncultured Lacinutrix sp.]
MLDKNINKTELTKIIRTLIAFIIVDGKTFVADEQKEAYIKQYIFTLSKSLNGTNNFINVNTLWETMEKDILNFTKIEANTNTTNHG